MVYTNILEILLYVDINSFGVSTSVKNNWQLWMDEYQVLKEGPLHSFFGNNTLFGVVYVMFILACFALLFVLFTLQFCLEKCIILYIKLSLLIA